ncbi:MAG: hypothetical protein JW993_18670 [Sedimentisphaerales bacterium]|nr:hypothetical protein [Sedimentisphaerales bacterium]
MATTAVAAPSGYTGLYAFHKYWGKKPHEPIAFAIEQLTQEGQVVLDPFLGSGTAAREALLRSRAFVGFDINPVAVELSHLLIKPPSNNLLREAIKQIEHCVKEIILDSYALEDNETKATHYLWDGDTLKSVWVVNHRKRTELQPTAHDLALSASFAGYKSTRVRPPRFFTNARINAAPGLTLSDLMTGRAQRNLDLLIDAIRRCPDEVQHALNLCLTAASGQMTKMVFAVTGRGKTNGEKSSKIEVGSWVIGYWRPQLHFEVNVWNCFERRLKKLASALKAGDPLSSTLLASDISEVITGKSTAYIGRGDCRSLLKSIPDSSVHLVITDPPHSDRVPYLELSEFWNSLLGVEPDFSAEIVISNARERSKSVKSYIEAMRGFLRDVTRVIHPEGFLVVLFNSRKKKEWDIFRPWFDAPHSEDKEPLRYVGHFPCTYSAGSVVQDNRKGGLKSDHALVFDRIDKPSSNERHLSILSRIPGWSSQPPSLSTEADGK